MTGREISWCSAMLDALLLAWPTALNLDALRTASDYPHSNTSMVALIRVLVEQGFTTEELDRDTLELRVRASEKLLVLMSLLHRRHG